VPEVDGSGRADIGGWLLRNGVAEEAFVDLGLVPNAQMGRLVREAHVGLFTSRCEGGTNLVAMECMASGVPTILSANTGHLDLISDGQCYALREQCPALPSRQFAGVDGWGESSIDAVLAMLEHVYTHREEAARVGECGAAAMQRLSWDNQIDHLLRTIGDLL
jgi:glycosyltransferase involved in cell wall biosynthesis